MVTVILTTFGATANYVCDPGYEIAGVSSRVCQSDGIWSDLKPACQLKGEFIRT